MVAKDPVDKLTHALCGLGRPFEIFNSKRKLFYYHSVTPQYRTRGVNMLYAQRTAMPRSPTSDRCDQLIFRGNLSKSFQSFFIETMELILTHTGRLNFTQLARCGRSCESRFRQPRQGICPFCWYSCELLFLEKCRFEAKTLWIIAEIGVFLVWKNAGPYVGTKNIALH